MLRGSLRLEIAAAESLSAVVAIRLLLLTQPSNSLSSSPSSSNPSQSVIVDVRNEVEWEDADDGADAVEIDRLIIRALEVIAARWQCCCG